MSDVDISLQEIVVDLTISSSPITVVEVVAEEAVQVDTQDIETSVTVETQEVSVDVTAGPQGPAGPEGPQGPPGSLSPPFVFVQNTPSSAWSVVHNLGYNPPAVSVIDSGGNVVGAAVVHINVNELVIHFGSAFSGTATLR